MNIFKDIFLKTTIKHPETFLQYLAKGLEEIFEVHGTDLTKKNVAKKKQIN